MKSIVLSFFVLISLSFSASAQFSGAYDPTNWNISYQPINNNTGSVDVTGAPASIIVIGSDGVGENDVYVDYTVTAATSGIWSFDWHYINSDADLNPATDIAYVTINGVRTQVSFSDISDPMDQTGDFSIGVLAGDIIGFSVYSVDNQFGGATFEITNFQIAAGTLPVTLSLFNAKQSGEQVKLDWTTQSESNSDRFEVERSTNGKDFKLISTVKAAGNSTLTQNYSAIDNNPENGNNYYRLRQVDLDGKFTYSMIKTLKWSALSLIKVYPNPVRNMVTLRFTPERTETTSITMFDGAGKTIQRRNIAAVAGSNMVTEWNVEALAPGIYFFRVNSLTTPLRFVKQ